MARRRSSQVTDGTTMVTLVGISEPVEMGPEDVRNAMRDHYRDEPIPEKYEAILQEWAELKVNASATDADRAELVAKLDKVIRPWLAQRINWMVHFRRAP
jgi:hypothetical protein